MSGLFSLLSATATALDAQSEAISVSSNNIANVNNPDYSEEVASYNSLGSVETPEGPQSMGISVSVQQERSAVLDQMVQQEASLTSGFTAQQNILQQAQSALGENITNTSTTSSTTSSVSTSGLSAALDDFFNAFQALAADPTDTGQMQSVVQQAGVLTDRFQEVDQNLAQVQTAAESEATSDVASANQLLQQVAQLNKQIAAQEAGDPGSALDLRDQREGALEKLAALVPISVSENASGEDQVSTTDASGNPVTLVSGVSVDNSLSVSAGVVSAGSTVLGLSSGSIQGELSAGAGAVQTLRTSLDQLAGQIVNSVNNAYNPTDTAGDNFFLASGTTAGTIALDPNLTAATLVAGTGSAGDNSIATAVANIASQSFSTASGDAFDGTISNYYGTAVSDIGAGPRHRQHPGHRPDRGADDRLEPAPERERRVGRPGDVEPDELPEGIPGFFGGVPGGEQPPGQPRQQSRNDIDLTFPAMRITNNMVTNTILNELQQLDSQQSSLQTEVSSGLAVTQPSDNPAAFGQVVELESQSNQNDPVQPERGPGAQPRQRLLRRPRFAAADLRPGVAAGNARERFAWHLGATRPTAPSSTS